MRVGKHFSDEWKGAPERELDWPAQSINTCKPKERSSYTRDSGRRGTHGEDCEFLSKSRPLMVPYISVIGSQCIHFCVPKFVTELEKPRLRKSIELFGPILNEKLIS